MAARIIVIEDSKVGSYLSLQTLCQKKFGTNFDLKYNVSFFAYLTQNYSESLY